MELLGEHNVPTEAFKIFFVDLSWAAGRLKKEGREVQEIKIIFLRDIFDILRTETWFDFDIDERPWGSNDNKIEEHAKEIFKSIIDKNNKRGCWESAG